MRLTTTSRRIRRAAGLVGGGIGLAVVTGVGPGPSLFAAASGGDDGSSTTSTSPTTETTIGQPGGVPAASASGNRVVDAAGAGTVTFARSGAGLTLVSADPAAGWRGEGLPPPARGRRGGTSASRTGSSCVRSPVTGTTMTAATTMVVPTMASTITATTTAARAQASTTTTMTTTATTTAVPAPAQAPATTTAATAAAVATRTTRPGSRGRGNSPRQAAAISSTSSALAGCAVELPREREAIHAGEGFSQLAPAFAGVFGQVHPPVALAHRHQVASGHQAERVDVVRERHREPRLAPAGREGPVRIVDRPPVDGRLVRGRSGRGAGQQPAVRQGHGPAVAGVQL